MVEKVENPAESDEQHTEESSKYWDEAVSVRVDGKEAPEEEQTEEKPAVEERQEEESEIAEKTEEVESQEESEESPEEGEEEGEADPWEGVPESLKEQFEEERKLREKYEHQARSNAGRLGAFQKKIDELSRKLEEVTASESKDAGKKKDSPDEGDSIFDFPEWKQFEDEFGDVAKPQKAAMRRLYEVMHSRLDNTDKVSQEIRQRHDQQYMVEQAAKLEAERPGWRQYIDDNRPDFDDYVSSNTVAQELLKPNEENLTDAAKAKALVDLFRLHMDSKNPKASVEAKPEPKPRPLTPKRKAQLKSAGTPPPRSHPAPGRRSDDLPDPDAYEDAFRYFMEQPAR
jgi:hypothetical protein